MDLLFKKSKFAQHKQLSDLWYFKHINTMVITMVIIKRKIIIKILCFCVKSKYSKYCVCIVDMFLCGFGLNWFKFIKSNQNFSVCALWFSASIEVLFQLSCVLETSLFHRCSMVHRETNVIGYDVMWCDVMLCSVMLCYVVLWHECIAMLCSVQYSYVQLCN